jgi:phenylacetate-CoA ligase
VLVTNLHNLVQPIIRLAVADVMTIHPEPCPCGRALVRAAALDGRRDDVLALPARGGGTVAVLPAQFSVVTRDRGVREFQVRQEPGGVRILVVPCHDGDPELATRLRGAVARALGEAGADARVEVECCSALVRRAGKLQVVVGLS